MKQLSTDCRPSAAAALIATLALVWPATPTHAEVCADICPGTGACSFNDVRIVSAGSVLDCTGRDITIQGLGSLKVVDGSLTLIADDLTVDGTSAASGTITAVEGAQNIPGQLFIRLTGNLLLKGKLRANGTERGGAISVIVDGNITIPEVGTDGIEALGTSATADGGDIYVETKATLVVEDPILADSGAGSIASGGSIEIRATGNITTDLDGHISAYGQGGGGGNVTIVSDGSITLYEHVEAEGMGSESDGGAVVVQAGNALNVANEISVMGAVNSAATEAAGGSLELSAGCGGVAINAALRATGGQSSEGENGGIIDLSSSGPVTIGAGALVDVHSVSSQGDGGAIDISTEGLLNIANTAVLNASGGSASPAAGGDIRIRSCRVDVVSGALLDARGYFGGSLQVGATALPPATGTQPLTIRTGALLRAAGYTGGAPGSIRIAPLVAKKGVCSNGPSCQLNGDCTVGCETGTCSNANPDTAGVTTQFDITPELTSDPSLPSCSSACPQ